MIDWRKYIISDPQICHGQLCAKGTRVLVTNILDSTSRADKRSAIRRMGKGFRHMGNKDARRH